LKDLKKYFNNIVYVCYSTVEPIKNKINPYIQELKEQILVEDSQLWVIGRNVQNIDTTILSESVRKFDNISELITEL
jgi:hypothetical protein